MVHRPVTRDAAITLTEERTMGALSPRVTKQRVVGGLTFFFAATGIMYMLGADMRSLLLGVVVGLALITTLAVLLWALNRREVKGSAEGEPRPESKPESK